MGTRVLCACILMSLLISLVALAEDSRWAKAIRATEAAATTINSVERTFDGGIVAAGENYINNTFKPLFIKLSSSGKLEWAKTYGSESAHLYMALQTSDGGFVFVGSDAKDALVVKLDPAGNILWQKIYGASDSRDEARSIIHSAGGGFYVLGNSSKRHDVWCMKLNSHGNILWQKRYGKNGFIEQLSSAIGTNDGGLIFVGNSHRLAWVVKLNENGAIAWQKLWSIPWHEMYFTGKVEYVEASAITATADGGYVVGGHLDARNVFGGHGFPGWAAKLDSHGNPSWQKGLGIFTDIRSVREEKDGHILVVIRSGAIARLDSAGNPFWQTGFGKADEQFVYSLLASHETPSDGTVLVGSMEEYGLVTRTSADGLTCPRFREPTDDLFTTNITLKEQQTHFEVKANAFVVVQAHLTAAPASLKIINLCSQ